MSSAEATFAISIPDSELDLLKQKLTLTRLPDELDGSGWDYGVPLSDIRRLLHRWREGYDWRSSEANLNRELPQFTRDVEVDGHGTLNVHYVHKKSDRANAIPLLFVHGWPGSFIEVRQILPLLTDSREGDAPSFHVVALSLPGFGFSEAPKKPGFGVPQHAELSNKLMLALGYEKYVTQGGDWGAIITREMASTYGPKYVQAWHTNVVAQTSDGDATEEEVSDPVILEFEKKISESVQRFETQGLGYFYQQGTRPQTVGYSLEDSPVGLLAWIYEKLVIWTDDYKWEDDEVLEWVSIYWFSRAGPTASTRIYLEYLGKGAPTPATSTIPMGLSYFPRELRYARPSFVRKSIGNLVSYTYHEHGGHFAAHEQPKELVEDIRKMFVKGGPAYGVVPSKDGY